MDKKNKFFSRKFLVCLGEALLGMGAVVTGMSLDNEIIVLIGAGLTALGTGIYTFCEAWVDGKAVTTK